ncbi:MAG: beta-N-acetylhexosaminidase [Proteobacteria bacterium]|nr:beta-N-acetylhexosaminidase [Pseudomonadota bacterium]
MNENNQPLGVLMLDLEGLVLTALEQELLQRPSVGGLILFSRNFTSPAQLEDLIAAVRDRTRGLLIAVDQEGGRVQRFREGFLELPALHTIGLLAAHDLEHARLVAKQCGWAMAAEILHYGIDFSFAPVLDLYHADSRAIKERAFSASVELVIELARAYIAGMHEAGMAATGKHFPGHGTVSADSHVELPTDDRSAEELLGTDFKTFAACIDTLDAIMPAHVLYPAVDSVGAGYSRIWLQTKLRDELGFAGVVFSDDLTMASARSAGSVVNRAEMALAAGCDMILVCNDRAGAVSVADWLDQADHPGNTALNCMRGAAAADISNLYAETRWAEVQDLIKSISH